MLNRRNFVLTGTSAMAALIAAPRSIALPINPLTHSPNRSVMASYEEKLGDSFLMRSDMGIKRLTLKEVEQGTAGPNLEQFRLVFHSSEGLDDGLYTATHLKTLKSTMIRLERSGSRKQHFVATFSLIS